MKRWIVVLVFFLFASPLLAASGWRQWSSAEVAGFDAEALEAVRQQADKATSGAVVAVYRGRVLVAWGDVARKLELHSMRKSLYSAMYGIAVSRKLVDLNAPLSALGIDDDPPLTKEERAARLIDLLQARSGVYHPSAYAPAEQEAALPARGAHAPGTFWAYNNWDFNVAGALLERAGGKRLGVLFGEWIGIPVGMEDFTPDDVVAMREPGSSRWPALTFRMSARDLARFGQLWLDNGQWNGKSIVPSEWVARASKAASDTGRPGRGYGMMWWTYDSGSLAAADYPNLSKLHAVAAQGLGGQLIAVIPEADLVVVHRGDTDHGRGVSGRVVWSIVEAILAARRGEPKKEATFSELHPQPFASQLPELRWPTPITLSAEAKQVLVGSYEIRPGMVARVYLHEGALFAFMPGRGDAELFAISPKEFFVRVDPSVRLRFDGEGMKATMGGREVVGKRLPTDR